MAKHKLTNPQESFDKVKLMQKRKKVDSTASLGMIIIAIGLLFPLFNMFDTELIANFKWIFASGTVVVLAARCVNVSNPEESLRLKRIRRLEFWVAACFLVATFFWFYNENKLSDLPQGMGALAVLRDTILFSLAGAMIQVIASWLIYFQEKKEKQQMKE